MCHFHFFLLFHHFASLELLTYPFQSRLYSFLSPSSIRKEFEKRIKKNIQKEVLKETIFYIKIKKKGDKKLSVLNKLIKQAKNPQGFVGSSMLCIMNVAHTSMTKWALSKVKISERAIMLDIGCGGGKSIHILSKMNLDGKIYGIDYSKQAVENSIKMNKKDVDSGKVLIKQASVSAIPFLNDFFDMITAFQTHYFWPNLENDVTEVFRVLKPNGYFLIVAEHYKIKYHMTKFKTKTDIEKLLKETGYNNVIFHEYRGSICIFVRK